MGSIPFVVLIAAAILLFLLATRLSKAHTLAAALRPFIGKPVHIEVWGHLLPDPPLTLTSARSFGAGLLLYLSPSATARPTLLKIASPAAEAYKPPAARSPKPPTSVGTERNSRNATASPQ